MVPSLTSGSSFTRAGRYFLHDKGARTAERVAWTETLGMATHNPAAAIAMMGFTARHADELKRSAGLATTGRNLERPVLQFSLSWHPEQKPTRAEMSEAAREALEAIGMHGHQTLLVCHRDEPQPHVHVIVNRVHPETGRAAPDAYTRLKLSRWAERYERAHGKIYCEERVKNNERRKEGAFVKVRDAVIQRAWEASDKGASFAAALRAEGYTLARGERRAFVVVDAHGKTLNPVRQLVGVKAKDIRAKLADIDPKSLPSAAQARARLKETEREPQPPVWDREEEEREREARLVDAAIRAEAQREKDAKDKGRGEGHGGKSGSGDARELPRIPTEERAGKPEDQAAERAKVREQARFEGWANRQRAALQTRQFDEAGELGERHARARLIEEERLAKAYGPGKREALERLKEIEERQERGGLFYRLTGAAKRDRQEAHAARAGLASAARREEEAQGALKAKQEAGRARLEQRHEEQRRALERRIEQARERREHEEWKPLPQREPANDRQPHADRPRNLMEQIERDRARERERGPDRERDREREM